MPGAVQLLCCAGLGAGEVTEPEQRGPEPVGGKLGREVREVSIRFDPAGTQIDCEMLRLYRASGSRRVPCTVHGPFSTFACALLLRSSLRAEEDRRHRAPLCSLWLWLLQEGVAVTPWTGGSSTTAGRSDMRDDDDHTASQTEELMDAPTRRHVRGRMLWPIGFV
jgi:hypothetical protein